jgi:hypothetical protein
MKRKEFNPVSYFINTLKLKVDKDLFKSLICKKFNIVPRTFNQWVYLGRAPNYSLVVIEEIANDVKNDLPDPTPKDYK